MAPGTRELIQCGHASLLAEGGSIERHLETATSKAGAIEHAGLSEHIKQHNKQGVDPAMAFQVECNCRTCAREFPGCQSIVMMRIWLSC